MKFKKTTTGKKAPPLGDAKKPFGAVLRRSSFKPITKGVATFFKAIFKTVTFRKSDVVETVNQLGLSNASPDEVPIFTEPSADPATHLATHPDAFSPRPTGTTTQSDLVTKKEVDTTKAPTTVTADPALPTEATPALNIESPLETPKNTVIAEDIAPVQDEVAACSEVTVAPTQSVVPLLNITPDPEPVMTEPTLAPETSYTTIQTASDSPVAEAESIEVPTIVCTEPVALERALDTDVQDTQQLVQTVSPQEDTIFSTEITQLEEQEDTAQGTAPAADNDATNTDTVPALVEDSDSDDMASIRATRDNNEDLELETDSEPEVEGELENPLGIHIRGVSQKKGEEPATTPIKAVSVHPVIYEDDSDAGVSSIINDDYERFLQTEDTWSVPQIVEKGFKSEYEILQKRFASWATAPFNPRLEDAVRELQGLDVPSTVQVAKNATAPAPIKGVKTRMIKKAGTPTTKAVETPNETRAAEAIPMAVGFASRNHSRSSSGSSVESASASFQSVPYPDTPSTEYSEPSTKDEAAPGANAETADPVASCPIPGAEQHDASSQSIVDREQHDNRQAGSCSRIPKDNAEGEEAKQTDVDMDDISSEASSEFIEETYPLQGTLRRCTWIPVADPSQAVAPRPCSIELRLTTPEGKVFGLEDPVPAERYEEGELDFEGVPYGHVCEEGCVEFLREFGFHAVGEVEERKGGGDMEMEVEGPEYMDQQVALHRSGYSGPVLAAIPEGGEANEDAESDIEPVDMGLLDRIEAQVERGCRAIQAEQERDRAAALANKVSFWNSEPSCATSSMSWADIDKYDDEREQITVESTAAKSTEPGRTQPQGAAEANKVSFWDRDPSYITPNMSWADIDEYDD
ncbi:hypothetical protein B0I37DRAFT_302778 [Chaetomium sp. MPI-CAGE-AT-0009]|nr:hypothetical protein B0I37DRAFT_302778 [Chaetomium sp. MPI-CAGE-AT-0009]